MLSLLIRMYESEFPRGAMLLLNTVRKERLKQTNKQTTRFRMEKKEIVEMMSSHFRYINLKMLNG